MKISILKKLAVAGVAISLLTGFGLGDLTKEIKPDTGKCEGKKDSKNCKKNEQLKAVGKAVAIGVAAKLVHDMVIGFTSKEVRNENKVIEKYKAKHKTLPDNPLVSEYKSSIKPGDVVHIGKEVRVVSDLEVVPGKKTKKVNIEERITIYDNEDNSKVLKSTTKAVNKKTKRSGAFKNQFKFTLPVGMPQGVYPIKSVVLVNKKVLKPVKNRMQLVLKVNSPDDYRIVALAE